MKALMRSRMSLFTAGAAAFAGGLALLISNGERTSEAARLASANAAPTSAEPASGWNDLDFLLCHTPSKASTAITSSMVRLAAAQTEAPQAKTNAASPALAFADTDPPVWDGLGSLSYKVTTSSAAAQVYFDQGLRLTYAFNHEEAQRAFRKAQKLDPDCAMCFWGEALVLGPNLNLPMVEEAVAPAFAAMQKARTLAAKASPREQALITALSARYVEDAKVDRTQLDTAYAAAMANVAAQFPQDNEIAVLYAESVMDLSPWNYWQPGGREPNPQSGPIVPTLERVLARDPDHPGAIHYYIHAVEASDRPKRAEPYADRLRGAVPGAGHLVHMPSHIFYRVGRYLDALGDNKTAVAVDETYLAANEVPMGVYRLGYYPHNVHFVMASALMAGDRALRHYRGGETARPRSRPGRARHPRRTPGEGGAVLRPRPVQPARHHPRAARSRHGHSICQGDVALRARYRIRRAARFQRGHRRGERHRNAGTHGRLLAAQDGRRSLIRCAQACARHDRGPRCPGARRCQ